MSATAPLRTARPSESKVVFIGAVVRDELVTADGALIRRLGGCVLNAAAVTGRLGAAVTLVFPYPDDLGTSVVDELSSMDISVCFAGSSASLPSYTAKLGPDGTVVSDGFEDHGAFAGYDVEAVLNAVAAERPDLVVASTDLLLNILVALQQEARGQPWSFWGLVGSAEPEDVAKLDVVQFDHVVMNWTEYTIWRPGATALDGHSRLDVRDAFPCAIDGSRYTVTLGHRGAVTVAGGGRGWHLGLPDGIISSRSAVGAGDALTAGALVAFLSGLDERAQLAVGMRVASAYLGLDTGPAALPHDFLAYVERVKPPPIVAAWTESA